MSLEDFLPFFFRIQNELRLREELHTVTLQESTTQGQRDDLELISFEHESYLNGQEPTSIRSSQTTQRSNVSTSSGYESYNNVPGLTYQQASPQHYGIKQAHIFNPQAHQPNDGMHRGLARPPENLDENLAYLKEQVQVLTNRVPTPNALASFDSHRRGLVFSQICECQSFYLHAHVHDRWNAAKCV